MSEPLHTATWDELACPVCDKAKFVKVYSLRRSQTGGTIEKVEGWQCLGCQETADVAAMIRAIQLKQKRRELEQLERDLKAQTPTGRRSSVA